MLKELQRSLWQEELSPPHQDLDHCQLPPGSAAASPTSLQAPVSQTKGNESVTMLFKWLQKRKSTL